MTADRPLAVLARSLEPLPGFMLRLSHRLELSPRRVAELTGLHSPRARGVIRVRHALSLDPAVLDKFAQATAMPPADASELCLSVFRRRYPPLADVDEAESRGRWNSWVLQASSRYCPQCLAGDGTAIQDLHGGPWRRTWRLGVVFACQQHRRLLATSCPVCGNPAFHRSTNESLTPREKVILHPAQCRAVVATINRRRQRLCETRLDEPPSSPDVEHFDGDSQSLALQQRILDMLNPSLPATTIVLGQTIPVTRYFADLRLLSMLIQMSWDRAKEVAASITSVDVLDASIQRRVAEARHAAARLPADARAAAELLLVADSILSSESSAARSLLHPMLTATVDQPGWKQRWVLQRSTCSPALAQVLEAETKLIKSPDQRRIGKPGRVAPTDYIRVKPAYSFDHRHIPQFLEAAWFEEQLGFLKEAGVSPVHLRRTIAIRLVELSERVGPTTGAKRLGCPYSRASSSRIEVLRWLKDPTHRNQYRLAIETLVEVLGNTPHLIDYDRRRQVLSGWSLSQKDWSRVLAEQRLPGFTEDTSGDPALADDVSRLAASAFIWARVTGSEARIAPAVVAEAGQAPRRAMLGRAMSIYAYRVKRGRPSFLAFQAILDNFADELTKSIDT